MAYKGVPLPEQGPVSLQTYWVSAKSQQEVNLHHQQTAKPPLIQAKFVSWFCSISPQPWHHFPISSSLTTFPPTLDSPDPFSPVQQTAVCLHEQTVFTMHQETLECHKALCLVPLFSPSRGSRSVRSSSTWSKFHCYADDTQLYLSTTTTTLLPQQSIVNYLHAIKCLLWDVSCDLVMIQNKDV